MIEPRAAEFVLSGARQGRFDLAFHQAGGRTRIGRRYVSYPFHMTRPFALDAGIPALTTVYQQSSSGGLYRDDRLSSRIDVAEAAAAHVTTQAATVVHDCHGLPARQDVILSVAAGGFLAHTPDPLVLFPGAAFAGTLRLDLGPSAAALISDAFAWHDPTGRGRPFASLAADIEVTADGRRLLRERFTLTGCDLADVVGPFRVVASHLLLAPPGRLPAATALEADCAAAGVFAGVSTLPNGAGLGLRLVAPDAPSAHRAAEAIFRRAVQAALGAAPAPRRK
ncbi:urease accessory protein UreD [Zavarzinia sp.]|uniref:urease accessory protein UreD n=1 Tax=Zavarzinia sp. TaxID=2027920 RepID=UPI00356329A2